VAIANALSVCVPALREGFRPDPLLAVSEWADQHRYLSQRASAEPGRWRTNRTPYLQEIMDSLGATSSTEKVVFVKGAQVGGTEAGNNWIGYTIDLTPAPMLVIQPTVDIAKRFSRQRLQPLIDETPRLREKVKPARERDSGNSVLSKEFPGGIVLLAGANSAAGLRSMPIARLFADEVDAYPGDVEGEGDPIALAEARTRTFSRRKILLVSTPTIAGTSRIWREWELSDQRRYHVPCPHCGAHQPIAWDRIRYDDNDPSIPPVLMCEHCGTGIEERYKPRMLAEGQWIPENPDSAVRGYHLSSLYSPLGWFSWGDAVRMWREAQNSQDQLRVFVNTVLGEVWAERGDAPEWEQLYRRRENYDIATVPAGGLVLTAGVDVQSDRIELEVVAWGPGLESWSVEYVVIQGDTASAAPWAELARQLERTYPRQDGGELPVSKVCVDTGYNTATVYAWCRQQPASRVLPIKGRDALTTILGTPSSVDVNVRGKTIKGGVRLWPVGVSVAKTELYGWLRQEPPLSAAEPFPRGFCHFPQYGEEYFQMLTAEELQMRLVKGFRRYDWVKTRPRNEALDCRVYARAAATAMGLDRWPAERWAEIAASFADAQVFKQKPKEQQPAVRRRRSSYLSR
jgi:phage terminase large subunit GpA-like protein